MAHPIDPSDVTRVSLHDLYMPMKRLIETGRGLALLNGLTEEDIRELESEIWVLFADRPHLRVAVALRFRALLDVFAGRRLKDLFLHQGFKLIAKAVHEAANQRLNARFGFRPQAFVTALSTANVRAVRFQSNALEQLAA